MRVCLSLALSLGLLPAATACGSSSLSQPPPGGVTVRADDFERADGGPGPNWAWQAGVGAPTIRGGRLGSVDEKLVITWWTPDDFAPDQFSEGVVSPGFDPTTTFGLQVFVRRQDSGTPWRYGFHFNPSNGNYELKYDGGSPGIVLVSRPGVQFKPGDVIRIEVRGSILTSFLNGALMLTTTHSALTGGRPGVVINSIFGTTRYAWDLWRGGESGPLTSP